MNSRLYRRFFLNKKEGMAAMQVSAEQRNDNWVDANVTISDCSRQIGLDFDFGRDQKKEKLAKLDGIIESLTELRAFMETCNPIKRT